jgi:hypothetical protein
MLVNDSEITLSAVSALRRTRHRWRARTGSTTGFKPGNALRQLPPGTRRQLPIARSAPADIAALGVEPVQPWKARTKESGSSKPSSNESSVPDIDECCR